MTKKQDTNFPIRRVPLNLKESKYSVLTPEKLREQMHGIGLTCPETEISNLIKHKNAVLASLQFTNNKAYKVLKPNNNFSEAAYLSGNIDPAQIDEQYIRDATTYNSDASGEWEINDSGMGYQMELTTIQVPTNFDYLLQTTSIGFSGKKNYKSETKKCYTLDAIKNLYVETGKTACALFTHSINKYSLESFFSNAISAMTEPKADYKASDSRIMLLALNYDEKTKDVEGIGVINISWGIEIKNYKNKDKNGGTYNDTTISITCRGVFYSDPHVLERDYLAIKNRNKNSLCLMEAPKDPVDVPVFDTLPPADRETFLNGIPGTICDEYIESVIVHTPFVDTVQCEGYGLSLPKGFDFEINLNLGGVKYRLNIQNENASTEYMIDGRDVFGKKAHMSFEENDGYLTEVDVLNTEANVLRYYTESQTYEYVKSGKLNACGIKIARKLKG